MTRNQRVLVSFLSLVVAAAVFLSPDTHSDWNEASYKKRLHPKDGSHNHTKASDRPKRWVWWQDYRGNYSFEVPKCWKRQTIGKIPSYSPTSKCPKAERRNWRISLAYSGPFSIGTSPRHEKGEGWFDFTGVLASKKCFEIEKNGIDYFLLQDGEHTNKRIWVAKIDCNLNVPVTGDLIDVDQIDPTFTEHVTRKGGEHKIPDIFERFARAIHCEQENAQKIDKARRQGLGTLEQIK